MPAKGSGSGVCVHPKGYLRITRRGRWRGWLVHRRVMYEACQEFCYYPVNGNLPDGMTVEHVDHDKQHNCIHNLLLLDARIHDVISNHTRWTRERLVPHWVDSPETGEEAWTEGRE